MTWPRLLYGVSLLLAGAAIGLAVIYCVLWTQETLLMEKIQKADEEIKHADEEFAQVEKEAKPYQEEVERLMSELKAEQAQDPDSKETYRKGNEMSKALNALVKFEGAKRRAARAKTTAAHAEAIIVAEHVRTQQRHDLTFVIIGLLFASALIATAGKNFRKKDF